MDEIVYDIINLLASLTRMVGMGIFGVGIGWLTLDLLKKNQGWQVQIAIYLGAVALAIAAYRFLPGSALGAFGAGVTVAVFVWGIRKPKEEHKEKKD